MASRAVEAKAPVYEMPERRSDSTYEAEPPTVIVTAVDPDSEQAELVPGARTSVSVYSWW